MMVGNKIKPSRANIASVNHLLVKREQDEKELLYQRGLEKTEQEKAKWDRGRREGKREHYHQRSGRAVCVHEARAVDGYCGDGQPDTRRGVLTREKVQKSGQSRGEDHSFGQARRQTGLDTGGSGRDTEVKQAGRWSRA